VVLGLRLELRQEMKKNLKFEKFKYLILLGLSVFPAKYLILNWLRVNI